MSNRKPKKSASHKDAAADYYVPYTSDELSESRGQRKFLNAVNLLNARLWMCVHFAECACEAIRANDHYRAYSYFRALDIGNEFASASVASAIQRIREQIISNGEGNAPVAGSVNLPMPPRQNRTQPQLRPTSEPDSPICSSRGLLVVVR